MNRARRVVAAVAVLWAPDRILMQLRDDRHDIADPNCWVVPGGGVEPRETIDAAARRELREETEYCADALELLHTDRVELSDGTVEDRYFFVTRYDGVQPVACREGQALRFLRREDLTGLRLGRGHAALLDRVFAWSAGQTD